MVGCFPGERARWVFTVKTVRRVYQEQKCVNIRKRPERNAKQTNNHVSHRRPNAPGATSLLLGDAVIGRNCVHR